jgi:hypothetical protein
LCSRNLAEYSNLVFHRIPENLGDIFPMVPHVSGSIPIALKL